jgi:hypothetical protein
MEVIRFWRFSMKLLFVGLIVFFSGGAMADSCDQSQHLDCSSTKFENTDGAGFISIHFTFSCLPLYKACAVNEHAGLPENCNLTTKEFMGPEYFVTSTGTFATETTGADLTQGAQQFPSLNVLDRGDGFRSHSYVLYNDSGFWNLKITHKEIKNNSGESLSVGQFGSKKKTVPIYCK